LTAFAPQRGNPAPMRRSVADVLAIFRRYQVGPHQMLFINNPPDNLRDALVSLINAGLVQRERPKNAYCLTERGFAAVRSLSTVRFSAKRPSAVAAER
jgi:predicted transcriptional regulator